MGLLIIIFTAHTQIPACEPLSFVPETPSLWEQSLAAEGRAWRKGGLALGRHADLSPGSALISAHPGQWKGGRMEGLPLALCWEHFTHGVPKT